MIVSDIFRFRVSFCCISKGTKHESYILFFHCNSLIKLETILSDGKKEHRLMNLFRKEI